MRVIIFRGKCTEKPNCADHSKYGEWIYGLPTCNPFSGDIIYITERAGSVDYKIDPETIGQYTGLKDKDGVKIFEGDVLSLYDEYNSTKTKDGAPVSFSHKYVGGWIINKGGNNLNIGTRAAHTKVIGTIHDKTKP